MSEKINYPFIPVPKDLIEADLPLAEFKLVVFLIGNQILDEKTGLVSCFYGIPEIARQVGTSQAAIRRSLYSLQNKKIVIIEQKAHKLKSGQFTNGVRVDFSAIGGLPKIGEKMNQGDSSLAEKMNHGDSKMNHGDSKMNHGDSSHKDIRFKNIYLKNIYTEMNQGDSSYMETGDSAPVRSMPMPDKSGGNQQEKDLVAAQLDICDMELVEQLKTYLQSTTFCKLYRVNGDYIITANSNFCHEQLQQIYPEMQAAAAEIGRALILGAKNTVYNNGIIIDFQQLIK